MKYISNQSNHFISNLKKVNAAEEVCDSPVKIPRVASTISFTATSLLPMLSLLTSLPFVRLNADGIIDWVKYAPRINFNMKN